MNSSSYIDYYVQGVS